MNSRFVGYSLSCCLFRSLLICSFQLIGAVPVRGDPLFHHITHRILQSAGLKSSDENSQHTEEMGLRPEAALSSSDSDPIPENLSYSKNMTDSESEADIVDTESEPSDSEERLSSAGGGLDQEEEQCSDSEGTPSSDNGRHEQGQDQRSDSEETTSSDDWPDWGHEDEHDHHRNLEGTSSSDGWGHDQEEDQGSVDAHIPGQTSSDTDR